MKNEEPKALTSYGDKLHDIVIQLIKKGDIRTILDAPAGEGALCEKLHNAGFEVFACDIDPTQFKFKSVNCAFADLNNSLPFSDAKFDAITCVEGIEHLINPSNAIQEFSRTLKKGGRLIITTPNINSVYSRFLFLTRGTFYLFDKNAFSYGHISPIFYPMIEHILRQNNFIIERITNEQELLQMRRGQKMMYYSFHSIEKILGIFLTLLEEVHRIKNKLNGKDNKLSSTICNEFINDKMISKGMVLIIIAKKT